jgi:hypothetical protein
MKLMRYAVIIGTSCALAAAGVYLFVSNDPYAPRSDWPVLQAAAPASDARQVTVGKNICVSVQQPGAFEYCTIAADPADSSRLFAACLQRKNSNLNLVGFYSWDGGSTWALGCERIATTKERRSDPSVCFGPNGVVYLVVMRFDPKLDLSLGSQGKQKIEFLASTDGGKIWEERGVIPIYIDRPWLAVETAQGPHLGRVYCVGNVDGLIFSHSDDGAMSFGPLLDPIGLKILNCRLANPAITSNGTLLLVYEDRIIKPRWQGTRYRPQLHTLRSRDGGETFEEMNPVNTKWRHDTILSSRSTNTYFPQLAADPGSQSFDGRVYCVWADGNSDLAERIFFSSSSDDGETWTDAIVVSEQPMEVAGSGEQMAFIPSIAVNLSGVVAVSWYDRRGLLPGRHVPIEGKQDYFTTEAPGWNVRLRASLDGGRTWLPSVQVNEEPGHGEASVGHAAGLAASPDGRFHAAWVDNRTGRRHLWTAAIEVDGEE